MTVDEAFKLIEKECDPRCNLFYLVTGLFPFMGPERKSNFIGGNGDDFRTKHEKMFSLLYPRLKWQVVFGTGAGGLEKYHAKRFIADFYDEANRTIYEIDGTSHKSEIRQLKDKIRDYFFLIEHGIQTVRLSNSDVEKMVRDRIKELSTSHDLKELFA